MSGFSCPDGFLWGSATAAHQVEGRNIHSDWWAWEQAGRVKERSGDACDHYRRFADDFDLAVSLGHTAHRFSIEWSRIEPAEGQWDDAPLAHYAEVLRALRQRHLEPIVTLHHFTTPQWLTAQGGWTNPKVIDHFAQFVRRAAEALGPQVTYWVTINEPMVFVRMHYLQGLGPPGVKDLSQALQVIEHLIRAHAVAYHVLHEVAAAQRKPVYVSIAKHLPVFAPCRPWWPMDPWVTWLTDRASSVAFLQAVTEGRWSVPGIATWDVPDARNTLDYLGINYYGRQFIRWVPTLKGWPGDSCDLGHHPLRVRQRTSFGWDVHPASLYRTLTRWSALGLPILITENGTWMEDDAKRWQYILGHLQAMARAMQHGVRVLGYCYWSLLDNFEWADGYAPRFGLIGVDYRSQERRIRDSARRYAEVCHSNRIPLPPLA